MFSLRSAAARTARSTLSQRYTLQSRTSISKFTAPALSSSSPRSLTRLPLISYHIHISPTLQYSPSPKRQYSSTGPSPADDLLTALTEQYSTARDEFEIACEETEKNSTYAESDREAAREELDKLKAMYEDAVKGEWGEEVKRRVGSRVRELENAVVGMERRAIEEH